MFVGSFNFDPRSIHLNTELGFVIDSPPIAQEIRTGSSSSMPEQRLPGDAVGGRCELYWLEQRGGKVVRHDVEPGTSIWLRAGVWLLSLLPIDWML